MSRTAGWKPVLLIVAAMLLSLLIACNSNSGDAINTGNATGTDVANVTEAPKETEPPKEVVPPKEPIELTFYQPSRDWSEERFMEEFGDPIKAKFPHITSKFLPYNGRADQVGELLTAGEKIDISFMSIGQVYNFHTRYNMQYDIAPFVKKHGFDTSVFEQSSADMLKQIANGELIGFPIYTLPSTIYYNRDLFDQFGVDYPGDQMTWDELYDLSEKMTRLEGDVQYYGTVISVAHLAMRNQLSLNLIDPATGSSVIDTTPWKTFMDNVTRFYQSYGWDKTEMGLGKQRDKFTVDKTAAMWLPVSTMYSGEDLQNINWDLAAFPSLSAAPGIGPQAYPFYFLLANTSKHKEDAFEVLTYLASEEFHMDKSKRGVFLSLLNNPEIKAAFATESPMYEGKNAKALFTDQYAKPSYVSADTAAAAAKVYNVLVEVVTGENDVNTSLRTQNEAMNKTIDAKRPK